MGLIYATFKLGPFLYFFTIGLSPCQIVAMSVFGFGPPLPITLFLLHGRRNEAGLVR